MAETRIERQDARRHEVAQPATSGETLVSFAAMQVWPSSPFDGPDA
jgi:hypothetical protein